MEELKLAHIGIAVKDIHAFGKMMQDLLQAQPISAVVEDPNQQAFLQMFRSGQTCLELIAPAGEKSHVHTVLKRQGEGLIHMCYETDDLAATLARARKAGMVVFRPPVEAALFGGKKVAFAMMPNTMVIEFVEAGWAQGMEQAPTVE